jgi:hypothetical protein
VAPCILVNKYQRFGGTNYLHLQNRKLHMPSWQLVPTCQAYRHSIPEENHIHTHCHENLKSHQNLSLSETFWIYHGWIKKWKCNLIVVHTLLKATYYQVLSGMGSECYMTRNCSGVAVTRLMLDDWRMVVRFLTGVRNIFSSKAFIRAFGSNNPAV